MIADYADLDKATAEITNGAFAVTGQRCTSISRLIVLRKYADELEAKIAEKMMAYVLGSGMDPRVTMGPVINKAAGESIMDYIQSVRDEGAITKAGGRKLSGGEYDKGFYIEPTLVTNATPTMKVSIDEIFGPVLTSIRVDTFAEAMQVANDTKYGLSASLFSDNLAYIHESSENIKHFAGILLS